jgi:3-oxoacyl-[acyl-carrier protein] reductase
MGANLEASRANYRGGQRHRPGRGASPCAAGTAIIIADCDEAAAEQLRHEISAAAGMAEAFPVDVACARQVKEVVGRAVERFARIDIVANIAGGSVYTKRVEEFTWREWNEVIDINLKGTFLMCREVAPIMRKQRSGRILNTAANYGITGSAFRTPYSAAKAGIIAFTKTLAQELAPDGILVNTVAPGPTDTPRVIGKESPEARKALARELGPDGITVNAICPSSANTDMPRRHRTEDEVMARLRATPLRHVLEPEDIVGPVLFLASAAACYITGQSYNVNCGSYNALAGC